MEIFCFFLGILYIYTSTIYLPVIMLVFFYITPKYPVPLFFLLGALIGWLHQWFIQPQGLPDKAVIPQAIIQGKIASIPHQTSGKTQFLLDLTYFNHQPAQGLIQLAWYNTASTVHIGEHWQFRAKLKKPRNFLNPGSADYVTSLNKRHILWTGYIYGQHAQLITKIPSEFSWTILRARLGDTLVHLAPNQITAGIIEALTLNLTRNINQEQWELFRRTGTTHLFGISGEHIALVSGLIYWLSRWLWSCSARACLYIPAPYVASGCGLVFALFYAFLAGFEPPVQRALIGCFFYALCNLGWQRFTAWQIWRYALLLVLCIEPHAVFMQGFYFSFLAVACLFLTQKRWQLQGYKTTLALQLSCLIGLMPLTLHWYAYGSINGFLANLLAIPLVSFIIVPLSLVTLLTSAHSIAGLLMYCLSWSIALLMKGLHWIEHLAVLNITWPLHSIAFTLAFMGALLMWVLLPIAPFRWLAPLWLLLPFFPPRITIPSGEAQINILDVGQGLAVAIHTKNHTLLYDTGDQFFQGSDLGKMVILPYLKTMGVNTLDTIVISHPDKDHRGGLRSIEDALPVKQLLVNDPHYYHHGTFCHNFPEWQWDHVRFRFLAINVPFNDKNNRSCILQIITASGRVLLTGDIEKEAEDHLVQTYGQQLASDVLIVPHHGSKTSSSYRFLLEISPRYAIVSLGFDNRFHFPHAQTLTRMDALKIPLFRTDECGMVQLRLPLQGTLQPPYCFNRSAPENRWNNPLPAP